MEWPTEKRSEFLKSLQSVEQVVTTFYRLLLWLIVAAVLVVVVCVIKWRPWGAGNQGEWLYFSIGVLIVLCWSIGQLITLGRRQFYRPPAVTFSSSVASDTPTWQFQIGNPAAQEGRGDGFRFELQGSLGMPSESTLVVTPPSEESLRRVEMEVNLGVPIEEVCQTIEPAYSGWSALQQKAYCQYLTTVLEQRGGR